MVERPGVLHFYDGRRVVSLRTDAALRTAIALLASGSVSTYDADALAEAIDLRPETARQLISTLESLGLLDGTNPGLGTENELDHAASLCSAASSGWTSFAQARDRLAAATFYVIGDSRDSSMSAALGECGVRTTRVDDIAHLAGANPATDLIVAAARHVDLEELNEVCLGRRLSWLPVGTFDGETLRVGPLMIANQTACYACLIARLSANVDFSGLYRDVLAVPPAPAPTAVRQWAESVGALMAVQWVGGRDPSIPGVLHTVVPRARTIRQATVLRVPRCRACGAADYLPAAAPWELPHDEGRNVD